MDTETERSRKRLLDKLDAMPGFENKNVAELLAAENIHTWSGLGRLTLYEWQQLVNRLPKFTGDNDGPNVLAPGHLHSLDVLHEGAQRDWGFKLTALDRKRRKEHMVRSRSARSSGATTSHVPLTSAWLDANNRPMPLMTVVDEDEIEDGDEDEHASKAGDEHDSREGDDEHTSKEGDEDDSKDDA
jgi:hypothetical protein